MSYNNSERETKTKYKNMKTTTIIRLDSNEGSEVIKILIQNENQTNKDFKKYVRSILLEYYKIGLPAYK